jgi:ribosomal protein L21E
MTRRIGGTRKVRGKFKRAANLKGKLSLRNYLATYNEGDNVLLKIDSITKEGIFHPRFIGKRGLVLNKRGNSYEVLFQDFNKEKMVIVHPIHLRKC